MKPEVEQFHARVHNVLIVEKTTKSWHDETLRRVLYVKCEDCEAEGLSKEGVSTGTIATVLINSENEDKARRLTPSCWKQTMTTRLSTSGFPKNEIL